ncbi:F-box protein SKIP24 isoform X2 [Nicotiana tomentosiformis]|uniref:F-box protein SKIP24 isoform X2 n=1 Tax=Nicotiana tomentosiformis TaxID=4098 RepID=UPI00388C5417
MSASALPDELWRRILEIGIEFYNFNYKDLCCLSITCRRLNRLSSDDSLWSSLFSADFPQYPIKQHRSSSSVSNKSLYKIREASVALNVWQPEVVRGKQKQIVEQCNVPVNNRIHAIEMELKLCKQQVEGFEKALRVEKRRMQAAKEKLASVEYHPLRDFNLAVTPIAEQAMRKRLRTSSKETRS